MRRFARAGRGAGERDRERAATEEAREDGGVEGRPRSGGPHWKQWTRARCGGRAAPHPPGRRHMGWPSAEEGGKRRAKNVRGKSNRGPAGANLSGGAPPHFDCDLVVVAPKDHLLRGHVTPARDTLAERAQDGQRVGVRSSAGAPDGGYVVDVLG